MNSLTPAERRQLLRFVCSFAWADLEVDPSERAFIRDLVDRLGLQDEDRAEALECLACPPHPDSIDPQDIPPRHRALFLKAARDVIRADGVVNERESTNYRIFKDLLR